ncbi:uncharacterized protein [Primulina huaijiensis]|uniref:uncharacterized protein n=1 Tax=Primulina huaijiensis TaxID=1492673 RepID=UPI003CC6F375
MKEKLGKLEFALFAMRTYAVWSERLKIVHKQKSTMKVLNVDWSEASLHEFQSAQSSHLKTTCPPTTPPSPCSWIAPPFNQLCLDVDAAYKETFNQFAIDGVVRDHEGRMILSFGMTIFKPQSVALAELGAVAAGIRVVQEHNILINHINSDSLLAVQAIMCPEEDLSYVGSCAEDIRRLLEQNGIRHLFHVRRSANTVAHALASFAIFSPDPFVWKNGSFPYWLVKLVNPDFALS